MSLTEQPKESDLEHVVSLDGGDVQAIDAAILSQLTGSWSAAKDAVVKAHTALSFSYPSVPDAFFSYRLRKLVAAGSVDASGPVDRQLNYKVRSGNRAAAA